MADRARTEGINLDSTVRIDAVVVSYQSAATLRECVTSLLAIPGVAVTVVDNASPDDTLATIEDLDAETIRSSRNGGFSYGCNLGAARGNAPFLLFLNPDARMDAGALEALMEALTTDPEAGLAGPKLLEDGELAWSQRRFPRLRSTFAQALFLHRLLPRAPWTDELIRDPDAYGRPGSPDWISGACMLVRRDVFEAIGGFDERFFLYCEDTDLCRRVRDVGHAVRFVPAAEVRHVGGASSGAGETRAISARSRILYARKHLGPVASRAEAAGVALYEATHAATAVRRPAIRRGHLAGIRAALASPARVGGKG
jgi:N-acetylglucosaminyl-diphospho-decaprenol L-rhamnosyltransferase